MRVLTRRCRVRPGTDDKITVRISRRSALSKVSCLIVGGSIGLATISFASSTLASSKVPKTQAGYKNVPRGSVRCDKCLQYLPPSGCKIVDGEISPSGSCDFFAPRAN